MAKQRQWFQGAIEGSKPLGWRKDMGQRQRIAVAVKNRRGDTLAAARALNALANVTTDTDTKRKARADASYLYKMYRQETKK
jgi:hypothetical protein